MRNYITKLAFLLCMLSCSYTSTAAEPTLSQGRIDFINIKTGEVVIEDSALYLAPGYTVKNKKGEVISAFSLKRGRSIEYKLNEDRKIKEIIIVR